MPLHGMSRPQCERHAVPIAELSAAHRRGRPSFRRLLEREPHQRVERRPRAPSSSCGGIDRGAGFGRLEAEIGERGERVGRGSGARGGRRLRRGPRRRACPSARWRCARRAWGRRRWRGRSSPCRPARPRGRARRAKAPTGSPARPCRRLPGRWSARGMRRARRPSRNRTGSRRPRAPEARSGRSPRRRSGRARRGCGRSRAAG